MESGGAESEVSEKDFYVFQNIGALEEMPFQGSVFEEMKILRDKLKDIEQHLTHYASGVGPDPNNLNHSDHDILEQFHGVETDVVEKWSPLQISIKLEAALLSLSTLQSKILSEELFVWKREQQLSKNGLSFTKSLENIQSLLSQLMDLHNVCRLQINQLSQIFDALKFRDFYTSLLNSLLNSVFIVEHQPPQVIKVKTKFAKPVTVRLLVGPSLTILNKPTVGVSIISEAQARELGSTVGGGRDVSGVIANPSSKMDLKTLKTEFKSLKLLDVDRKPKKGTQQVKNTVKQQMQLGIEGTLPNSVTDEKFCLRFCTELRIHAVDYKVSTISLPVVVVTHGVQEPQAWSTITWDNGFSSPSRPPFEVPQTVTWNNLSLTLSQKFHASTGKGLEARELTALESKLFHGEILDYRGNVSHVRLCKRPLIPSSGGNFTFWDWYWSALKLIEKYAIRSWRNERIYGFIGRTDAEIVLQSSPPGTFLVRFSETVLGGLSICYVSSSGSIFSLLPFTSKNLSFRGLSDTIWDLENLHTLYPNTPKHVAFPRTRTQLHTVNLPKPLTSFSTSSGNLDRASSSSSSLDSSSQYVVSYPKITIPTQFS